jgi:hypothetical protein
MANATHAACMSSDIAASLPVSPGGSAVAAGTAQAHTVGDEAGIEPCGHHCVAGEPPKAGDVGAARSLEEGGAGGAGVVAVLEAVAAAPALDDGLPSASAGDQTFRALSAVAGVRIGRTTGALLARARPIVVAAAARPRHPRGAQRHHQTPPDHVGSPSRPNSTAVCRYPEVRSPGRTLASAAATMARTSWSDVRVRRSSWR